MSACYAQKYCCRIWNIMPILQATPAKFGTELYESKSGPSSKLSPRIKGLDSSSCSSSIAGTLDWISSGNGSRILYSEIPIGLRLLRTAYSAITAFPHYRRLIAISNRSPIAVCKCRSPRKLVIRKLYSFGTAPIQFNIDQSV
jgi:hypothetical protein